MSASTVLTPRRPMSLVPVAGNLDAYISAVNALPVLDAEGEVQLAQRLHQQQDLDAAQQLVLGGVPVEEHGLGAKRCHAGAQLRPRALGRLHEHYVAGDGEERGEQHG